VSTIAIVYHSGFGHTKSLAEAVAKGAGGIAGANVHLVSVDAAEAHADKLDAADAIIFGSPTYMGGVSAEFAKFKDWTSKRWMEGAWRNKLAAGFTASASWNGDKHNTLYQLLTLALQHGMVWVRLGRCHGPGQCRPGRRRHRRVRLPHHGSARPPRRRGGAPLERGAARQGGMTWMERRRALPPRERPTPHFLVMFQNTGAGDSSQPSTRSLR
jgi:multimeric flavodoxin WrbA